MSTFTIKTLENKIRHGTLDIISSLPFEVLPNSKGLTYSESPLSPSFPPSPSHSLDQLY